MNIVLIELTKYHEECLYSQIKFLKDSGYRITLIIHPSVKSQIAPYIHLLDRVETFNFDSSVFFLRRAKRFLQLYYFIKKQKINTIIFNTASSKKEIIFLCLFLNRKIKCIGTIHNLKKINHSFSQKLISKIITDYFVINDFLLSSVKLNNQDLNIESYYPIYFPEYQLKNLDKKPHENWICIPGELDYKRRDYNLILEVAKNFKNNHNIKFVVLGKVDKKNADAIDFFSKVELNELTKKFIVFESFVDNVTFHSYLKISDFIMVPVITTKKDYLKYKITGAINLAFAHQKPLICNSKLRLLEDLKENSLFYNDEKDLTQLLKTIANGKSPQMQLYRNKKWNYNFQKEKYISFLGQNSKK